MWLPFTVRDWGETGLRRTRPGPKSWLVVDLRPNHLLPELVFCSWVVVTDFTERDGKEVGPGIRWVNSVPFLHKLGNHREQSVVIKFCLLASFSFWLWGCIPASTGGSLAVCRELRCFPGFHSRHHAPTHPLASPRPDCSYLSFPMAVLQQWRLGLRERWQSAWIPGSQERGGSWLDTHCLVWEWAWAPHVNSVRSKKMRLSCAFWQNMVLKNGHEC